VSDFLNTLRERVKPGTAVVGIYGLGYVGLPLALHFSDVGIKVIGFDIEQIKVDTLTAGKTYIEKLKPDRIRHAFKQGFEATTDFARSTEADTFIICAPTPLNSQREPDLSHVIKTVEAILSHFQKGQLLSLESTTWPGTTDEELAPRLSAGGFVPSENCALVFSSGREHPGNTDYDTHDIPKIIGGMTSSCLELGQSLYQQAIQTMVPVSSTRTAEMTKLLENIHRPVNNGLVNEMKIIADKMDINIHEVIRATATKPFGVPPYSPGPRLGGHCIPIDPFYLTWKAKEYGINTRFIELAGEINHYMPHWVVQKVADALNDHGKTVKGSHILTLGLTCKKNIGDSRESPAVEIMELLQTKGALIDYSASNIPSFPKKRDHYFDLQSINLMAKALSKYDRLVLATDHDGFDYQLLRDHAAIVIDTRGRLIGEANVIPA